MRDSLSDIDQSVSCGMYEWKTKAEDQLGVKESSRIVSFSSILPRWRWSFLWYVWLRQPDRQHRESLCRKWSRRPECLLRNIWSRQGWEGLRTFSAELMTPYGSSRRNAATTTLWLFPKCSNPDSVWIPLNTGNSTARILPFMWRKKKKDIDRYHKQKAPLLWYLMQYSNYKR